MAPPTPAHHLLIAGTGRAGTSFLVRLLHECGLDTDVKNGAPWHEDAQAGLEANLGSDGPFPYVMKSAWSNEFLRDMLASGTIVFDGLILSVRNLSDAAASRIVIELESIYSRKPATHKYGSTAPTQAHVPGGVVFSLEPVNQERILAVSLHRVLEAALDYSVPILLLKFPRFAT